MLQNEQCCKTYLYKYKNDVFDSYVFHICNFGTLVSLPIGTGTVSGIVGAVAVVALKGSVCTALVVTAGEVATKPSKLWAGSLGRLDGWMLVGALQLRDTSVWGDTPWRNIRFSCAWARSSIQPWNSLAWAQIDQSVEDVKQSNSKSFMEHGWESSAFQQDAQSISKSSKVKSYNPLQSSY